MPITPSSADPYVPSSGAPGGFQPIPYDAAGAIAAGGTPQGIADYLASQTGYDIAAARKAGASDVGIINHLSKPPAQQTDQGDFSRGFETAFGQIAPLAKGAVGLLGASAEKAVGEGGIATGIKNWGLNGYREGMQKLEPLSRPDDDLATAWDAAKQGHLGALIDYGTYWLGYSTAQLGTSALTGLVGAAVGTAAAPGLGTLAGGAAGVVEGGAVRSFAANLIGKAVAKEAAKIAEGDALRAASADVQKEAVKAVARDIAQGGSLIGYETMQELGTTYGSAEDQAQQDGRQLDGGDLARVWTAGLAAGAMGGVKEKLGLDALTGKIAIPGAGGRLARAATGAVIGGLGGGLEEGAQTALERIGAGQSLTNDDAKSDFLNSIAAGVIGEAPVGGIAGGLHAKQGAAKILDAQTPNEAAQAAQDFIDAGQHLEGAVNDYFAPPAAPAAGDGPASNLLQNDPQIRQGLGAATAQANLEGRPYSPLVTDGPASALEASQQPDVSTPGGMQQAIDRQAALTGQANAAGTSFERQSALDQAQTAAQQSGLAPSGAPSPASPYVDLTPMTGQQAVQRLAVLRNGQTGPLPIAAVAHPSVPGAFAIKQMVPTAPAAAPTPAAAPAPVPAAQVAQQLQAAAQQGDGQALVRAGQIIDRGQRVAAQMGDQLTPGDQQAFKAAYEAVAANEGVATPAQASVLDRLSPTERLYDRVEGQPAAPKTATEGRLLPTAQKEANAEKRAEIAGQRLGIPDETPVADESRRLVQPEAPKARGGRLTGGALTASVQNDVRERLNSLRAQRQETEAQAAQQTAQAQREAPAAAAAPPEINRVKAALALAPFQRGADDKAVIAAASRHFDRRTMQMLRMAATSPFELSAVERNRLSGLGLKMSTPRPAVVASGQRFTADAPMRKVLEQTARLFGQKIQYHDEVGGPDGYVRADQPNVIHLNANSSMPHLVVLGHEAMHQLRRSNPEAYNAVASAVRSELKESAPEQFKAYYGEGADEEEMVSDLAGNRWAEPDFLGKVFARIQDENPSRAPSIVKALIDALTRAINAAVTALHGGKGFATDELVNNLENVRGELEKAFAAFGRKMQEPPEVKAPAKAAAISTEEVDRRLAAAAAEGAHHSLSQPRDETGRFNGPPEKQNEPATKTPARKLSERRVVRGVSELLDDAYRSHPGDDLQGLPATVNVPTIGRVTFHAFGPAQSIAADYMKSRGMEYAPPRDYVKVDAARAERIAAAFDEMEHAPAEQGTIAAYNAMIDETAGQYRAILKSGLKVEFIDYAKQGDPYAASPRLAIMDVVNNNHLWVFSTRDGFGSNETFDASDNPLLRETEFEISGKPALANDIFRVVHDYFGHIKEGVGFRADGEENAWRAHAAMYSPVARRAMTTETRGQNSWVNYGPHAESNKTASSEDTVFADQKIGLLPEWVSEDGRQSPAREQTDTPEFKRWFEGSKVVDEGGDPKRVYTGTSKDVDFKAFKAPKNGIWFAADPESASEYAKDNDSRGSKYDPELRRYVDVNTSARVIPAYLSLKNPMRYEEWPQEIRRATNYKAAQGKVWDGLRAQGYDGVIYKDSVYVAFEPTQVKSAIGNSGAFDAKKADITKSTPRTELRPEIVKTLGKNISNLTPAERAKLRLDTASKLVDTLTSLPSAKEMAAVAHAGRAKRGWYAQSAAALTHVFGPDAPRFAALLAATSPQTSVESNLSNALNIWKNWTAAGRPTDRAQIIKVMGQSVQGRRGEDSVLYAWVPNTVRALTAEDPSAVTLSGPKVNSFMLNLRGDTEEVTNDAWMANFALVNQNIFGGKLLASGTDPGKGVGYMAMSARVREAAKALTRLTGEEWTPSEVQETIWSWAKTLYETANAKGEERNAVDLVNDRALTDDLINSTPDFGSLFNDPEYQRPLADAGYEQQLQSLRSGRDSRVASGEGSSTRGQAAPFAEADQLRHERRAAGRLDELAARGKANIGVEDDEDVAFSTARSFGDLTAAQEQALRNVGGVTMKQTVQQRLAQFKQGLAARTEQAVFDQFAPLRKLDPTAYMLARLTKGGDGTLEAMLVYGKPYLNDGVPDVAIGDKGFAKTLASLQGEDRRFMYWIAAQRAERLKAIGLENLFSGADIATLKTLDQGSFPDGSSRSAAYAKAMGELNDMNDSLLKIAEESGLIDDQTRALFAGTPYVPFYRVMDEADPKAGQRFSSGLVNQKPWQKLKGGTDLLRDDLLVNTLMNWSHLITASSRNRAAQAAMLEAVRQGVASPTNAAGKGVVRVMENGKAQFYEIHDPSVATALTALQYVSPSWLKPFSAFKRYLTYGVTSSPFFKMRNLIRDSLTAIAQSEDLGLNVLKNVKEGWAESNEHSQLRASMLAAGGIIRFGTTLEGDSAHRVRALVAREGGKILDEGRGAELLRHVGDLVHRYNEFGDKSENANRLALAKQLGQKGAGHLEMAFNTRDALDFSMSGASETVRFLIQTVPFFNARLQGLYRLGRAAVSGDRGMLGLNKRFTTVVSAVALASLALYLKYKDDPDWKQREQWDRDTYWWFKVGDTAFRIPKPFEVGSIGTVAERSWELMFGAGSLKQKAGVFEQSLGNMLANTFAFDPTPQLFKPLRDVYANKDSFTQRPIESDALQRLLPMDRYDERTSQLSRALAYLHLPEPVALVSGNWNSLSPTQIEYLTRAYFGSLGGLISQFVDAGLRPFSGQGQRPDWTVDDLTRQAGVASLPDRGSSYVTAFYQQAQQIDEAWASYEAARKRGDVGEAQALLAENGPELAQHASVDHVKQELAQLNQRMKQVMADRNMSGADKRALMNQIAQMRNTLARSGDQLMQ